MCCVSAPCMEIPSDSAGRCGRRQVSGVHCSSGTTVSKIEASLQRQAGYSARQVPKFRTLPTGYWPAHNLHFFGRQRTQTSYTDALTSRERRACTTGTACSGQHGAGPLDAVHVFQNYACVSMRYRQTIKEETKVRPQRDEHMWGCGSWQGAAAGDKQRARQGSGREACARYWRDRR